MKVILTESQYKTVLIEHYDKEKLYRYNHIVDSLRYAPLYIKQYIKKLPQIACTDNEGNEVVCTKIPEVLYQYLHGNF